MKKRPPDPVPAPMIIGALAAIALIALAVWFFSTTPAEPAEGTRSTDQAWASSDKNNDSILISPITRLTGPAKLI